MNHEENYLFSIITLFVLLTESLNANVWRVNNIPDFDADFSAVTTAIAAASPGDPL